MPKTTTLAQSDWNRPTKYERWYKSSLGRAYAASLERVLRPWLSESTGTRLLDIGCGPGLAMERLFSDDTKLVGMDCSLEMAHRAFARSQQSDSSRRFVVGSVQRIPFADNTFDVAFCVNCLEFVEHRRMAFAEIARILRPSGFAIIGVLNRRSMWDLTRRIKRPFHSHSYYGGRFFEKREVREYCTDAGLRVKDIKTAVHFPPIPLGPLSGIYDSIDRWSQTHSAPGGGVILCHATKEKNAS